MVRGGQVEAMIESTSWHALSPAAQALRRRRVRSRVRRALFDACHSTSVTRNASAPDDACHALHGESVLRYV